MTKKINFLKMYAKEKKSCFFTVACRRTDNTDMNKKRRPIGIESSFSSFQSRKTQNYQDDLIKQQPNDDILSHTEC